MIVAKGRRLDGWRAGRCELDRLRHRGVVVIVGSVDEGFGRRVVSYVRLENLLSTRRCVLTLLRVRKTDITALASAVLSIYILVMGSTETNFDRCRCQTQPCRQTLTSNDHSFDSGLVSHLLSSGGDDLHLHLRLAVRRWMQESSSQQATTIESSLASLLRRRKGDQLTDPITLFAAILLPLTTSISSSSPSSISWSSRTQGP